MWEMSAGKKHEMRLQESTKNAVRKGLPTSEGEAGGKKLCRQLAGLETGRGCITMLCSSETILEENECTIGKPPWIQSFPTSI
jgi:hypothetical protein